MSQSWLIGTLVEQGVRQYFKENATEVMKGMVTTGAVLEAVGTYLDKYGYPFTPFMRGVAYDAIRLLGPTCEGDECWLEAWGGPKALSVFCDEQELAGAGATPGGQERLATGETIDEVKLPVLR